MREEIKYNDNDWWSDNQKPKDCKKITPDHFFGAGDLVYVKEDTTCLGLNYPIKRGIYSFDSFDKYDNSCFVRPLDRIAFYLNIKLEVIILVHEFERLVV